MPECMNVLQCNVAVGWMDGWMDGLYCIYGMYGMCGLMQCIVTDIGLEHYLEKMKRSKQPRSLIHRTLQKHTLRTKNLRHLEHILHIRNIVRCG